jgi:oligoendopeptidase F
VLSFCRAIEKVVVPLVEKIHEAHRQRLGVETIKPWDVTYDGRGEVVEVPFEGVDALLDRLHIVFERIEPDFAGYFAQMREQKLMDLEPRTYKYPYSYNEKLFFSKVPFIFYNATGTHRDIVHIAHEFGHAFHNFEMAHLSYPRQHWVSMEFGEVPSTLMELLVTDHFDEFYADTDAQKRARLSRLHEFMMEWPYVAMTVEFQHWIYTHHELATNPEHCDEKWLELWTRYMKGVDYSDAQDDVLNQWRHILRLFFFPFYAVEYALAQVGSAQIWRNLATDYQTAMQDLRHAMSLGNTVPLPELFAAAGAKLAFDEATLQSAVGFIHGKLQELEEV